MILKWFAIILPLLMWSDAYAGAKVWEEIINDTMTAQTDISYLTNPGGMAYTAESTAVFNLGDFSENLGLAIRLIPAEGDTTYPYTLAVMVRGHIAMSSDSNSTFYWQTLNITGNAGIPDSTDNKFTFSGYPPGDGVANGGSIVGPWEGDRLITVFGEAIAKGRSYGRSNQWFSAPDGLYLPISGRGNSIGSATGGFGLGFHAPYVSVRVRLLTGPVGKKPRVIVSMVGEEPSDDD